jgi:hypothetical protein
MQGVLKVGVVVGTVDDTQSGRVSIQPLTEDGAPGGDILNAAMSSPCLGAGEGKFMVPGPMSKVLYADVNDLGIKDVPHKYVWLGAVAAPDAQSAGRFTYGNDKNDPEDWDNTEEDHLSRPPGKDQIIVDSGTPEAGNAYADNNIPQQSIDKFRGHKTVMSHKITEQGRNNDSVLVQARDGKRLHIDSGPAELHMDRVTLRDENGNGVAIRTGGKQPDSCIIHTERDQERVSVNGAQLDCIMKGAGDQVRDNKGTGNIEDHAYQGSHRITAEKDISRVCVKGDITHQAQVGKISLVSDQDVIDIEASQRITLRCGGSTIEIGPVGVVITAPNIDLVGTVSLTPAGPGTSILNTHTHMDGFIPGFVTSQPIT